MPTSRPRMTSPVPQRLQVDARTPSGSFALSGPAQSGSGGVEWRQRQFQDDLQKFAYIYAGFASHAYFCNSPAT